MVGCCKAGTTNGLLISVSSDSGVSGVEHTQTPLSEQRSVIYAIGNNVARMLPQMTIVAGVGISPLPADAPEGLLWWQWWMI